MSDKQDQAHERLKRLVEEFEGGPPSLPIPAMIEAVVGPAYDKELESLVTMALSANSGGMSLKEIADGILAIEDWRISLA
tara:strand:+ start:1476 stop:1715 length:240 start_codon:yes stop_codon:yes gene_type:complete